MKATPAGDSDASKGGIGAELNFLLLKESPIHGTGAFARQPLLKGARVIEYVGEKIDKRASLRRCEQGNACIFSLNDEQDLDGNVEWNPARFINHSCDPNCDAELAGWRIWITARRDIPAREEITFNYGYDLEDYKDYVCNCGAPNCVGYIVAEVFFDRVRSR